jgi:transposase
MDIQQIGIDIGKNSFHLIGLGVDGTIVLRRQFSRRQLIKFFERNGSERLDVAFEACSGAHWLAHQLIALGHEVRLLTPESVRPFAKAQKNDWNDAVAIAEAARRPGRHSVGIKSQEQLDIQALHRVRQRLVTARTAIINQIRGLLRERGYVFRTGRLHFERFLEEQLLAGETMLNPVSRSLFTTLAAEYRAVSTRIDALDHDLGAFAKSSPACRALMSIPGIGVIVATALFSAVADISEFKSGRDLAAFLGLVPRQRSTGGKPRLLGISKRGNAYVRTLMIHGMRSAFYNRKKRDNRITRFMERLDGRGLHVNKVVVASANKAARIAWAVLSRNTAFQPAAA